MSGQPVVGDGVVFATALALASAGLHASWNLLVKTSADRFCAAWGQFAFGGLLFLPVLVAVGGVSALGGAWGYLAVSSVVHVGYVLALVRSYGLGDFSLAYPLARGSGALLAALGGVLLLGDRMDPRAWVAIAVVVGGLVALTGRAVDGPAAAWALLTGVCIATYTLIDAAGARQSAGLAYSMALMLTTGAALSVVGVATGRSGAFARSARVHWRRYLVGGACATAAYSLVLVAVQYAPVGYVAVLRESSVVIGAYLGWVLLGERLGGRRLASSAAVSGGMALLIVLR